MLSIRESNHLRIPYEEIQSATKNFTTRIGRGGYGPVYRGQLSVSGELTIVAVKRLQTDYGQGAKQFLTEIQLLSRYKHQNLVSLVGFCEEHNEKFLIYEYAEHGSLDKHLRPVNTRCPFTWKQRVNICVDAARGLDHLHNRVAQNERIIHRDIKSANILLDHNWKAIIADFGLSKIGRANEKDTYLITDPRGTRGYWDPAYIRTWILTKESDVYSFGVVLLEILCGRMCIINDNKERFLVPLAQRYHKQGKLNLIVDSVLKNHMNSDSMKAFSEIVFQCLQYNRERRPPMDLVLEKLEKALKLLEMEEAPELLELEEVLGLQKLVEICQLQEACELQELEEVLGLQKLVEACQMQEHKEACELQELEVALGLHELVETLHMQEACEWQNLVEALELEIGESLIDYDVIKTIYGMRDSPLSYITRDKVYSHLSTGILLDEGKIWVSINDDGKTQEMISAIKFLPLDGEDRYLFLSAPESRFSKIANVSISEDDPLRFKIRTQFLSSDVTYAAYLVCKPKHLKNMEELGLNYTLNNINTLYVSYSRKKDDNGCWMFELFQTTNLERSADIEVTFVIKRGHPKSLGYHLFEGIIFEPVQKFEDEDEIEVSDPPTLNAYSEKYLPNDYKRYLYYSKSNYSWMDTVDTFTLRTEAHILLSSGVLIHVEDVGDMWFWITESDGKKCFMLPPRPQCYRLVHTRFVENLLLSRGETWLTLPTNESRSVNSMIHLLPSNEVVAMSFNVPNSLFSTDTTYGCFLVYKMAHDFVWEAMVKIKLDGSNKFIEYDGKLMHLSMPHSPVLGPDGVFISSHPINDLKTIQLPKKRKDGWLEMDLGNTSHIQWANMQQRSRDKSRNKSTWKSRFLPFYKESRNVSDDGTHNDSTIDHRCFSNIYVYFSPIDCFSQTPEVFVLGIEFRPL